MIEITTEQQQQINSVLMERYTELYNKSSNMLTNFFSSLPNPNLDEFDKLNAPYEIEMNRINSAYYALNGTYIFTSDYDEE